MNDYLKIVLCLLLSFTLCFIFCKIHLKRFNFTPRDQIEVVNLKPTHKFKSCGGIDFIIASLIVFITFNFKYITNKTFFILIFTSLYYFLIGLIDDLIKIKLKNHNGLSAFIRIALEIIGSLILINACSINLVKFIKIKNLTLYIGGFSLFYAIFIIVGTCNAINLTDGLDGLVVITYILAISPFTYIALKQHNYIIVTFITCLIGSLLAYLCFNFNPSKLIMGDVGSLSLGAILAIISILLNSSILLLISGGIYIVETLSVILQVSFYKLSKGKRLFKMAPLHYHFLKSGMKEANVVLLFTIIGIILAIISTIIGVII